MSRIFSLKDQKPVAKGRMRYVYPHPHDPRLVIKVIRPDVIDERWGSGQAWYKARRRFGQYISYMREIGEYIATYQKYGYSLPFTQKVVGLAETDLGLGLVLEAIRDSNGNLAPSLPTLIERGQFNDEAKAALETFIQQVLDSNVIVADLHGGNIVYACDDEGAHHFIMIDGLGLSNILPLKSIFPSLNRKSKLRHILRLRSRMAEKLRQTGY